LRRKKQRRPAYGGRRYYLSADLNELCRKLRGRHDACAFMPDQGQQTAFVAGDKVICLASLGSSQQKIILWVR
jgi:hypothetical protein